MTKEGSIHSPINTQAVSVQFWGLKGVFSAAALTTLLAARIVPQVVIIPDPLPGRAITPLTSFKRISLPVHDPAGNPDMVHIATQNNIPVFAVGNLKHPDTVKILAETRPDIAIVACFNQRIPAEILAIPRHGFLNIHPSLLPAFRGPTPLFWLFREAATEAMGVTIHQMDAGLDTGDIIVQQPLTFPDGISGRDADRLCARAGAGLIADMGNILLSGQFTTRKQPAGGSTFPRPSPADFTLDTSWPARRAFNFMCVTAEWQRPYPVTIHGQTIRLSRAIAFQSDTPAEALRVGGNTAWIRFRPGVLQATLHNQIRTITIG